MISPILKKVRLYILIIPLFFSCSNFTSRTFYNSLDYYFLYKINSFYDIDREQGSFLKKRLSVHLQWHRKTILPEYITILTRMKAQFPKGLVINDLDWIWKNFQNANRKIYLRLLDDSVTFLAGLEKEQIEHFSDKVKDFNKKNQEFLNKNEKERLELRTDFHLKYLTFFYGEFSDNQKVLLSRHVKNLTDFEKKRIGYLDKIQQSLISLLGKKEKKKELYHLLKQWFVEKQYLKSTSYRMEFKKYLGRCFQMVEYIDHSVVTTAQRKHAVRKCDELITMAKKLMKE